MGQRRHQFVQSYLRHDQSHRQSGDLIQDANLGGGERPDIVYRAIDALCARLAWRLAIKFAPAMTAARKDDATEAWNDFATRDQEMGGMVIQPNVSGYWRI